MATDLKTTLRYFVERVSEQLIREGGGRKCSFERDSFRSTTKRTILCANIEIRIVEFASSTREKSWLDGISMWLITREDILHGLWNNKEKQFTLYEKIKSHSSNSILRMSIFIEKCFDIPFDRRSYNVKWERKNFFKHFTIFSLRIFISTRNNDRKFKTMRKLDLETNDLLSIESEETYLPVSLFKHG